MAVIDKKTRRSLSNSRAEGGAAGSRYEALFGVEPGRNRRPGRPSSDADGGGKQRRFLFSTFGKDKDIAKKARQRAIAVLLHENKDRASDLYEAEYEALSAAAQEQSEEE